MPTQTYVPTQAPGPTQTPAPVRPPRPVRRSHLVRTRTPPSFRTVGGASARSSRDGRLAATALIRRVRPALRYLVVMGWRPMGIKVALEHRTSYSFDRLVEVYPHVVRLRPAPHCERPSRRTPCEVEPADHFVNWQQDAFGNFLARLVFPSRTRELTITVGLIADLKVINPFDFFIEDCAETYPVHLPQGAEDDLEPYLRPVDEGDGGLRARRSGAVVGARLQRSGRNPHHRLPGRAEPRRQRRRRLQRAHGARCADAGSHAAHAPSGRAATRRGCWCRSCASSAWPPGSSPATWSSCPPTSRRSTGRRVRRPTSPTCTPGPRSTSPAPAGSGWTRRRDCSPARATSRWRPPRTPSSAAPITGATGIAESTLDFSNTVTRVHEDPRVTLPYTDAAWRRSTPSASPGRPAAGRRRRPADRRRRADVRVGGQPGRRGVDHGRRRPAQAGAGIRPGRPAEGGLGAAGADAARPGQVVSGRAVAALADRAVLAHATANRCGPTPHCWPTRGAVTAFERRPARPPGKLLSAIADGSGAARLAGAAGLRGPAEPAGGRGAAARGRGRWTPSDDLADRQRAAARAASAGPARRVGRRPGRAACCRCTAARTTPAGPAPTGGCAAGASCCSTATRRPGCGCRWTRSAGSRRGRRCASDPLATGTAALPAGAEDADAVLEDPETAPTDSDGRRDPRRRCCTSSCRRPRRSRTSSTWSPESRPRPRRSAARWWSRATGRRPDARLVSMSITPDPGVIEVNVAPSRQLRRTARAVANALRGGAARPGCPPSRSTSTAPTAAPAAATTSPWAALTPADSPLLRRPDLLVSLLTYWQRHPALSYLFAGRFVGTTSQAPRVDEGRSEALYELEIAFAEIARLVVRVTPEAPQPSPWVTDRALRHLLTDITGNTHRAEFCIDKLYSPDSPRGRLGILELRGFEMPPHFQMAMVQSLLVRSLVALVLGRAAARAADPPRTQPARPIPVAALHHSRYRRRRRGPARPRHRLRHQLAGSVHRVPLPADRHRGVRPRRDRAARRDRAVEHPGRGVHRRRHRPLRRLLGGAHPGPHHRRRPPAPRRHLQRLSQSRCWPPTTPTSRSAACATAPGSRPARCTPPSPSTARCASNWSTSRPARPAAGAPITSPTPVAAPTTARRSTPWRPSPAADGGSRPPASPPGNVDVADIREKQARQSIDVGAPGILDLRRVRTVLQN